MPREIQSGGQIRWFPHCNIYEIKSRQIVNSRRRLTKVLGSCIKIRHLITRGVSYTKTTFQSCHRAIRIIRNRSSRHNKIILYENRNKSSYITQTCDEILALKLLSPESREPTMYMKVLVSKLVIKVKWLSKSFAKSAK